MFYCEKCGKQIVKFGDRQITFCEHYPPEKPPDDFQEVEDLFGTLFKKYD